MTQFRLFLASTLAIPGILILDGCSHAQLDKKIEAKVGAEDSVTTRSDLHSETKNIIGTAPGLSEDQRTQLLALRKATDSQTDAQRKATLQLRSVLIKDILAKNYDEDEVEAIKDRLRKLEDEHLVTIFDAVKKANAILGRGVAQNKAILHDFLDQMPGDARQ